MNPPQKLAFRLAQKEAEKTALERAIREGDKEKEATARNRLGLIESSIKVLEEQ